MDLERLQVVLKDWLDHNFPNATPEHQFFGVVEEVGELSHAYLKNKQKIRGYSSEKTLIKTKDAVGDIVIFLINFCNTMNINFNECLITALEEILKRDWIKYPETGEKPK